MITFFMYIKRSDDLFGSFGSLKLVDTDPCFGLTFSYTRS